MENAVLQVCWKGKCHLADPFPGDRGADRQKHTPVTAATSLSKTECSTAASGEDTAFSGRSVPRCSCPRGHHARGRIWGRFSIGCSAEGALQSPAWNSFGDGVPDFTWRGVGSCPHKGKGREGQVFCRVSVPSPEVFGGFGCPSLTWPVQTSEAAVT